MNRWAAICRLGGMGDNLVAASPMRALKRLGYMTEMICNEKNHVVYLNNPHIDKLAIKEPNRDLPQGDQLAWQKWFLSRSYEYDIFAHLSHSMEGRHALFPALTSFWWPQDYRRKICAGSYLETAHDIVGVPYDFGPLYFHTDEELDYAREVKSKIGERMIVWVISGSRIDKVYPYTDTAITRIIKELNIPVVMMGVGEKERAMALVVQEQCKIHNSKLDGLHLCLTVEGAERGGTGDWPIRRSLAMAHIADLVISPDTGPAWSVAFEPMPKIILHSHASVENICKHWINTVSLHADPDRVPCWPCHRLHDDPSTCVANEANNGAKCISDISVEAIFEATKMKLGEQRRDNVLPFNMAVRAAG
jgi:ADP-heptose:LPS heptosyltransferase